MKILVKAGLVLGRREGRWTHYSIVTEGLNVAMEYVQGLKNILEAAN
jgi:DNA-binding transcriptional ArsR family regulator